MKQFLSFLLCCTLTLSSPVLAAENSEADLSVSAPSVLLMEASTGTVVYEKNAHEIRHPASITKIMTLILIFDAIERGQHLPDRHGDRVGIRCKHGRLTGVLRAWGDPDRRDHDQMYQRCERQRCLRRHGGISLRFRIRIRPSDERACQRARHERHHLCQLLWSRYGKGT